MSNLFLIRVAIAAALPGAMVPAAWAGLAGQMPPTGEARAKIMNSAAAVLKGDIATGRPDLLLAVQGAATTDFTELVNRVVGDDTSYTGLVETVEEALTSAKPGDSRDDLIYNLVRLHLLRSQRIMHAASRAAPLTAAAEAAEKFPSDLDDPAAWALKGDVYVEMGDTGKALAAYRRMTNVGASGAEVQYKIGWANERANQMPLAATAYQAALRAQLTSGEGGPQLRHLIYQALTRTTMTQGDVRAALAYLAKSATVGQDDSSPFNYRLDAARRLLQRGYAREVLAYTKAALVASPDDQDAAALRDQAAMQVRR